MGHAKNALFNIGVVAITALTSFSANASFLIEPHLGYGISGSTTYSATDIKYNGPQFGAKFGFQNLGLMAGLDYNHATYTLKETPSSGTVGEDKKKKDELGIFVGYSAPIMLRAWLGYFFSTKQTQTAAGTYGANGDWLKGHTTEIGIGFTPLPLISLNLLYRMVSFDKQYSATTGVESTPASKYEPKEIVFGVSLPFTLL